MSITAKNIQSGGQTGQSELMNIIGSATKKKGKASSALNQQATPSGQTSEFNQFLQLISQGKEEASKTKTTKADPTLAGMLGKKTQIGNIEEGKQKDATEIMQQSILGTSNPFAQAERQAHDPKTTGNLTPLLSSDSLAAKHKQNKSIFLEKEAPTQTKMHQKIADQNFDQIKTFPQSSVEELVNFKLQNQPGPQVMDSNKLSKQTNPTPVWNSSGEFMNAETLKQDVMQRVAQGNPKLVKQMQSFKDNQSSPTLIKNQEQIINSNSRQEAQVLRPLFNQNKVNMTDSYLQNNQNSNVIRFKRPEFSAKALSKEEKQFELSPAEKGEIGSKAEFHALAKNMGTDKNALMSEKAANPSLHSLSSSNDMAQNNIQKVVNYIVQLGQSNQNEVEVKIQDSELGNLELKVVKNKKDASIEVGLKVQNEQVSEALVDKKTDLIKALNQSGIKVSEFKVDTTPLSGHSFKSEANLSQNSQNNYNGTSGQDFQQNSDQSHQKQRADRRDQMWEMLKERYSA